MALMTGANRWPYDAAAALRPYDQTPATADGRTAAFSLNPVTAYWGGYPSEHEVVLVVHVLSLKQTVGDEGYVFAVELTDNDAFTGSVKTLSFTVTKPGIYALELDVATLRKFLATADRLALNLDVSGTAPSIDFAAYVSPDVD